MERPTYELGKYEAVVYCPTHKEVVLTKEEYISQMKQPDEFWKCPICGSNAIWSDENYEVWIDEQPKKYPCPTCDGSGSVTCKRCHGSGFYGNEICCGGTDDCPTCDGSGEVDEDYSD